MRDPRVVSLLWVGRDIHVPSWVLHIFHICKILVLCRRHTLFHLDLLGVLRASGCLRRVSEMLLSVLSEDRGEILEMSSYTRDGLEVVVHRESVGGCDETDDVTVAA